jgi:hypothetical protein
MSDDFIKKLQLYKDGKLSGPDEALIEKEIEKYTAIRDYLDDDGEFLGKLKEEIDHTSSEEGSIGKKINRKMIKKIVGLSLATIIACLILIPVLYISVSSLLGRAFRVESNRFAQEENFARQFLNMAFPQVTSTGGSDHTEFYNQQFTCNYIKGISRKEISGEIEVKYSFGKLKKPTNTTDEHLQFLEKDKFYAANSQTYFNNSEWEYLERAPEGTKARIFITFKSKLSPRQAFTSLGEQYFNQQRGFNMNMLADIDSEIVIGNVDPVYWYSQNKNSASKQDELDYIKKFNACDNDTHKQVLLFGLNQIKKYRNISDYIAANYVNNDETPFKNIDGSISYVEKNGVQYVGALITGDTKELLKLKSNPDIYACSVEDIVVW